MRGWCLGLEFSDKIKKIIRNMAFPSGAITLSAICDAYVVPRNMGALRGKSIFNADGTSTTVPATGAFSMNSFRGKYSFPQISWTAVTENPFGGQAKGIAWNGSYWVAVGYSPNGTTIATSDDGIDWTARTSPFSQCNGVAWNSTNNYWVAVGRGASGSNNAIATSPDGIEWTNRSNHNFSSCNGIAWNGSYWVAVGSGRVSGETIATSTDGENWSKSTTNPFSPSGQAFGIAWNGSYWVAVGYNQIISPSTSIAKSDDGMTWEKATGNQFSIGRGIAWNSTDNYWLASGSNGRVTKSNDGKAWNQTSNTDTAGIYGGGIAWNGKYWINAGSSIKLSTDGTTWNNTTNNPLLFNNGIAWNGTYWLLVGTNSDNTVSIAKSN